MAKHYLKRLKKSKKKKQNKDQILKPDSGENYEFDMSLYKDGIEEEGDELTYQEYVIKFGEKEFNRAYAKWSPHDLELESITQIKTNASKYGIAVESFSDNINDLWKHLGCLGEYWARIKYVCNKYDRDRVDEQIGYCRLLLIKNKNKPAIPDGVYLHLLKLRDMIYRFAQMKNFGFSIGTASTSPWARAEKQIIK